MRKNKIIILTLASVLFFSAFYFAMPRNSLASIQSGLSEIRGSFGDPISGATSVNDLMRRAINIIFSVTSGIAILFLIFGGYMYITSAGNEETAEKGRKTITNAVIGLVIIILSYVIVRVIVELVSNNHP
jgi:hypothetical protein